MEKAGSQRIVIRPSILAVRRFSEASARLVLYSRQYEMEVADCGSNRLHRRVSFDASNWLTVSKLKRSFNTGKARLTASSVARTSGAACNSRPSWRQKIAPLAALLSNSLETRDAGSFQSRPSAVHITPVRPRRDWAR